MLRCTINKSCSLLFSWGILPLQAWGYSVNGAAVHCGMSPPDLNAGLPCKTNHAGRWSGSGLQQPVLVYAVSRSICNSIAVKDTAVAVGT